MRALCTDIHTAPHGTAAHGMEPPPPCTAGTGLALPSDSGHKPPGNTAIAPCGQPVSQGPQDIWTG